MPAFMLVDRNFNNIFSIASPSASRNNVVPGQLLMVSSVIVITHTSLLLKFALKEQLDNL